jgi:hypothetical protein
MTSAMILKQADKTKVSCSDKFSAIREGAEQGSSLYSNIVSTARYFHETLKPVTPAYSQVSNAFLPFRAVAIGTTPFELWNMGTSIKEIVEAPGKLKIMPLLKTANSAGVILDQFATAVEIAAGFGAQGIELLTAATIPISIAAFSLQLLGAAVNGWTVHEIKKEWDAVEKILQKGGKKPNLTQYREAVERLTKEATTRKEKFKQAFFGILSSKQKEKLKAVFNASVKSNSTEKLDKAFHNIKKHVKTKKVEKITLIVLSILALAAVMALCFVIPSPLAIACWTVAAVAGVGGLIAFFYGLHEKRRLSRSLSLAG